MRSVKNLILGAGISGLSTSYHVGHKDCVILEKKSHPYGLLHTDTNNGFYWDKGPHVSFTKHEYVKKMFADSVNGEYEEHKVNPTSYFSGTWIDHPVQTNLYQVNEEIREDCVQSFLEKRQTQTDNSQKPQNYREWLEDALGEKITDTFFTPYTRKYWTTEPENLTTDWIGPRIFNPKIEDVLDGAKHKLDKSSHYITTIRYPSQGGYQSFANFLTKDANILLNHSVVKIDLQEKTVYCQNGEEFTFENLVSTIPLPIFVHSLTNASNEVKQAADKLACSQMLLVNVEVPCPVTRNEHWMYVYDSDKISARITLTEKLSNNNTPSDSSGIQVEVYFSRYKPYQNNPEEIGQKVVGELFQMGIIPNSDALKNSKWSTKWVPYANIIFDHNRKVALNEIFTFLEPYGFLRRPDELDALTDWTQNPAKKEGSLILVGRFGEWKYYWSDDCLLAGKLVGPN